MRSTKIIPCVIGLGYVGLPIFLRLKKKFNTVGYDNNEIRIKDLIEGVNENEPYKKKFNLKKNSFFTNSLKKISHCNFYIVCVPTPVFKNNKPNLKYLELASKNLAKVIKKNDIVVFESTVYPGVTKKCSEIIEKYSKLKKNKDFYVGYSPERVNPGDQKHTIEKISKIVATENSYAKKNMIQVYRQVSNNIVFSKNIKEAETSKVIENIQRDLNIALMNEIFIVCNKLKINFKEVLGLASTKWNFYKAQPGLVGGHCLPVDPYYFSHLAKKNKIDTKILLAGRKVNNSMKDYVVNNIKKKIKKNDKILICGVTYKANVPDIRNSLSLKIANKLQKKYKNIDIYDPLIDKNNKLVSNLKEKILNLNKYKFIIFLVNHDQFEKIAKQIRKKKLQKRTIDLFNFYFN